VDLAHTVAASLGLQETLLFTVAEVAEVLDHQVNLLRTLTHSVLVVQA
jgi:hypothetical protein